MARDLSGLSDDELRAEMKRRQPKRIKVREYEVDEDTYRRMHGRSDDEDEDEEEEEEEDDKPAARKKAPAKRRGYFD